MDFVLFCRLFVCLYAFTLFLFCFYLQQRPFWDWIYEILINVNSLVLRISLLPVSWSERAREEERTWERGWCVNCGWNMKWWGPWQLISWLFTNFMGHNPLVPASRSKIDRLSTTSSTHVWRTAANGKKNIFNYHTIQLLVMDNTKSQAPGICDKSRARYWLTVLTPGQVGSKHMLLHLFFF